MCRSNLILKLEHPHFGGEVIKSDHVAAALQSPVGNGCHGNGLGLSTRAIDEVYQH